MLSTVNTTTTAATLTAGATLGFMSALLLISLLVMKELSAVDTRLRFLERALNVSIAPLLMIFALIVSIRILEVL